MKSLKYLGLSVQLLKFLSHYFNKTFNMCGNRNVVFAELHCLEGGNVVLSYAYSDKKV